MNEACRADLNSRSACDHELYNVFIRFNAAAADDRDIKNGRALSNHTDSNGLYCRT